MKVELKERDGYFVHESSYLDPNVSIGEGTRIWHFCHIMSEAKIGKNCTLGQNVFVGARVIIGNNVKIQNNVSIYEGVIIEDDVFLGPSCVFTNISIPRSAFPRRDRYEFTYVKRGATLGANCTVICGHRIGEYAFIGAGAVVTKDVPDYALSIGVPAKVVGWRCVCGEKLLVTNQSKGRCIACKREIIFKR
jgi:UDP-2-acetamido-3-amino-2,3-dideoxy-glucuronate N-acetyltransferase